MRVFVAIEIPGPLREGLAAVQARLKGGVVDARWTRPSGFHLTLKFLGEVGEELVPRILQGLASATSGRERFDLRLEGLGTFPNPASARVVWLGIAGEVERLVELQAAVENALVGVGPARDARPYTPHLTLGRIKRIRQRSVWLKGLEDARDFQLPGFAVTAIRLISSALGPSGASYRELGSAALSERPARALRSRPQGLSSSGV